MPSRLLPTAIWLGAFLGLTGVWIQIHRKQGLFLRYFVQHLCQLREPDNDSVSCWESLACNPGVVLSAGTGVVSYGVSPGGQSVKVGGWGYIMGDLGSAFDIGQGLVLIAQRVIEGAQGAFWLSGY